MELQRDDWVKTETGKVGRVLHTHRLTAFIVFSALGFGDHIEPHLISQLIKVEQPIEKEI